MVRLLTPEYIEMMEALKAWISSRSDLFLFTQTGFWVFFAVVLIVHSVVSGVKWLRSGFLLLASLYFYYKTGGYFFSLLIFSTLVDYSIGLTLGRTSVVWQRRLLLFISLAVNLSILGYFKYTYFIMDCYSAITHQPIAVMDYLAHWLNRVAGSHISIDTIVLPVGISFFTFQTISYTVDVYRQELKPVRNIIDFGFYVSFFPQLIAGPIVRAKSFIPQIYCKNVISEKWFWWAVLWITGGLFKKMVISDYISVNFVDRVFENPLAYSGFEVLLAVYGYALQIYCDFSGYTDIALGVALLLGFRLPLNFNHPYKSLSVREFWRRWHISLSSWLRDYLYIPLGGNKGGGWRMGFNLMVTMLLGGLWHGAALKFVLWGGLHGIALGINRAFHFRVKPVLSAPGRMAAWLMTFHFVAFTWIIFRVDTLENGLLLVQRILKAFRPAAGLDVLWSQSYVFVLMVLGFALHFIPDQWQRFIRISFIRLPLMIKVILSVLLVYIIVSLHQSSILPFIYFRF